MCRPNQPLDENDIAVIETEKKVTKFVGVNEQTMWQRHYETCAILGVTKVAIFCDFGDSKKVEVPKKDIADIYKVTALLLE